MRIITFVVKTQQIMVTIICKPLILINLFFWVCITSFAQTEHDFISVKTYYYPSLSTGYGGSLSGGYYHKGIGIGGGVGVLAFGGADPYIPVFLDFNLIPTKSTLSPYINIQAGYGFYKGTGKFIDVNRAVKGSVYMNMMGGISYGKNVKGLLYAGVTPMVLREKTFTGQTSYTKALFTIGIGIMPVKDR
jgi:hypothetical protein